MEFEKATESVNPHTCAVIYAHPGKGKTTSIGLMNPEFRKLIIDIDESSAVLRSKSNWNKIEGLAEGIEKTSIFRVGGDLKNLRTIVDWLMSGRYADFDLIVVDNLTEYEQRRLRELASTGRNRGVPEQAHYAIVQGEMTQLVFDLRRLPVHKIFTAWETVKQSNSPDGTQYTLSCPSLAGKSADNISGICNVVARLEMGEKSRFFRLEATETIYAKDGINGRKHCPITELIKGE